MTIAALTTFFGWMTVLNLGLLLFTGFVLLVGREKLAAIHANLLGMEQTEVKNAYFYYLANFKIVTLVFCITPYIALKLL